MDTRQTNSPVPVRKADAAAKRQEDAAKSRARPRGASAKRPSWSGWARGARRGPPSWPASCAGRRSRSRRADPAHPEHARGGGQSRLQEYAALLRYGPVGEVLSKALAEPKRELVPETTTGYSEGGKYYPLQHNAAPPAPPPETPGMRTVTSVDARGRQTFKQEPISVGSDREGLESIAVTLRSRRPRSRSRKRSINTSTRRGSGGPSSRVSRPPG